MNPQKLEDCPGFIGADAPSGPGKLGRVVIDPARVHEAYQWLRRRFDVREELELCRELDGGLCVTIMARPPRKPGVTWRKSSGLIAKPVQFELPLGTESDNDSEP